MQRATRKPADAPPLRIGPLATLPVFFDLTGKKVVLVGGTAAAAWKGELLSAAGAHLHVYAEDLEPEMASLIMRMNVPGTRTHHTQQWSIDVFAGAALALADIDDPAAAKAFFCAARAAGVPVNVIDKPALCQYQFGSIVNRSPIVIGISTDGAAPILAQEIRRRIETILPPGLAAWGEIARTIRSSVMAALAKGTPRRRFWEALAARAFARPPDAGERQDLGRLMISISTDRALTAGHVTLVGAGPGDAELLTLKAVRAMQAADVILFDDLVSVDVLELGRREARRIRVGKRGQRESCAQDDINDLMIGLAREGNRIVRLKSGDPMIFGRAGEEIDALQAAGVTVDVVPGVSAAMAAAARLGISLTHRDHARSLRFVTGHARTGELPVDLDWRGLADPATTLVVYMGGRTAGAIAARLLTEGASPGQPALVMSAISTPDERIWRGPLTRLADGVATMPEGAPCLIGVGRVFASRRHLPQRNKPQSTGLMHIAEGLAT
jgi:uroporphyrin-III C-methyltransferase / precorrin-2 dehydrogenase / sirohydrochlorin ferrochelatase